MFKKSKGFGTAFLISYLGAFLPVMIVSVLVFGYFNANRSVTEQNAYRQRTEQIAAQVQQLYTRYYENSIRLYDRKPQLRPDKMTSPLTNGYGIEVLQDVKLLDDTFDCVFGYYSVEDLLHTSGGSVGSVTFFETSTNCTAISAKDGLKLLASNESGAVFLTRRQNVNGNLYMHFPVNDEDGCISSLNYLVPSQNLADLAITPYATELCYVKLSVGGADAWFTKHADRIIPIAAAESPTNMTPYLEVTANSDDMGLKVTALYSAEAMAQRLRAEQRVYYMMLAGGTMLSVLLSFIFVSHRLKSVRDLEAAIRGEDEEEEPTPPGKKKRRVPHNEFTYIKSLVADSRAAQRAELARYASLLATRNDQLRRQTVTLLFHGLFSTREAVNEMLNPCGIVLHEEFYYIGVLLFDGAPQTMERFSALLCADLYARQMIEGREVLFFLAELPGPDDDCDHRMDMAVRLNHVLAELGAQHVRAAFSRTYAAVGMAGVAFQEAAALAEQLCRDASAFTAPYVCWEQVAAAAGAIQMLNPKTMHAYTEAVRAHRYDDAAKQLHKQLRALTVGGGSPENQRYLRYGLVQPVVDAIRDADLQNGDDLLAEALHIDPSNGASFERALCSVLSQYCRSVVAQGDFSRILDYIRANFTDPELSAEQVADRTGVDKSHLGRLFRAKTGVSYMDYVTNLRMERARLLLADGRLTIREIVQQIGYIDDSSFRRKFRAIHGVPVSEYRDKVRHEKDPVPPKSE